MEASALSSLLEDALTLPAPPAQVDPPHLARLARGALSLGHPLLACEWLLARRELCELDDELRFLTALAQTRIGGYRVASRWLSPLLTNKQLPAALRVDVLSLAGRIAKDRWARLPPGDARDQAAVEAIARYREAWLESGNAFPGINAATLLFLTGDTAPALKLAAAVARRIADDPQHMQPHWRHATLGEAALLQGDLDAAARHYSQALKATADRLGDIASMRRQLRLIAQVDGAARRLLDLLPVPAIVAFTGHMIDAPNCASPRFPAEAEQAVAAVIAERLQRMNAGIGYCSAACGGDLLFIEAMLARGAEVHVTLPFARDDFLVTSVAFAGEQWVQRFDAALRRVTSVSWGVSERYLGDQSLFAYAATLLQGAALLRARELDSEPVLLALVDRQGRDAVGGTLSTVAVWQQSSLGLEEVDLSMIRSQLDKEQTPSRLTAAAPALLADSTSGGRQASAPEPAHPARPSLGREVRTMLFADVVGYSRLAEEHTPAFLLGFLGYVAELVSALRPQPVFVNTWGDGLFMVFDEVRPAAHFALQLRDAVADTDWQARGLPEQIGLRIGMHTGPVFPAQDPLLERINVFGTHVTRAARIEPVAAANSVFVSAETAYTLAAGGEQALHADYLGSLPLAKAFGNVPLFRLRRTAEPE